MRLKIILLLFAISLSGCVGQNDNQTINEKDIIYDWNIELYVCQKCSSYKAEIISQKTLANIKNEVLSSFEKNEIIFDKFGINGLSFNVSNDLKHKLEKVNVTDAIITTVRYNMIIDEDNQKAPKFDEDYYLCKNDRECIYVAGDCCGCSSLGTATTINKDYFQYWNEKQSFECKRVFCAAAISDHKSCFAEPKCINNKCELVQIPG